MTDLEQKAVNELVDKYNFKEFQRMNLEKENIDSKEIIKKLSNENKQLKNEIENIKHCCVCRNHFDCSGCSHKSKWVFNDAMTWSSK